MFSALIYNYKPDNNLTKKYTAYVHETKNKQNIPPAQTTYKEPVKIVKKETPAIVSPINKAKIPVKELQAKEAKIIEMKELSHNVEMKTKEQSNFMVFVNELNSNISKHVEEQNEKFTETETKSELPATTTTTTSEKSSFWDIVENGIALLTGQKIEKVYNKDGKIKMLAINGKKFRIVKKINK
jgi:hypothetical protein